MATESNQIQGIQFDAENPAHQQLVNSLLHEPVSVETSIIRSLARSLGAALGEAAADELMKLTKMSNTGSFLLDTIVHGFQAGAEIVREATEDAAREEKAANR